MCDAAGRDGPPRVVPPLPRAPRGGGPSNVPACNQSETVAAPSRARAYLSTSIGQILKEMDNQLPFNIQHIHALSLLCFVE